MGRGVKTIEREGGDWLDRMLNEWPLLLDMDTIRSIGIAWLFKDGGRWRFRPRITPNAALFYNAVFFLRLSFPFGIFVHVRWAENWRRSLLQTGLGWKLNGRIAALFRLQSDTSAAAGVTGPNYGQATGFEFGPH